MSTLTVDLVQVLRQHDGTYSWDVMFTDYDHSESGREPTVEEAYAHIRDVLDDAVAAHVGTVP